MAAMDTRHPPRFVPTLTDVVPETEPMPEAASCEALPEQEPELVDEPLVQAVQPIPPAVAQMPEMQFGQQDWADMAQSMQSKVMARLDEALEERLRYALADMVQLHTQTLYQAIRTDVERMVSSSVHEAIAQELALMRTKAG